MDASRYQKYLGKISGIIKLCQYNVLVRVTYLVLTGAHVHRRKDYA